MLVVFSTIKEYTLKTNEIENKLKDFSGHYDLLESKLCVVSKVDEKVIGACGIRGPLNILTIFIMESFRRKGVGTRLLKRILKESRENGHSFILLSVDKNNIPIRQLYLKLGFRDLTNKEISYTRMGISFSAIGTFFLQLVRVTLAFLPGSGINSLYNFISRLMRAFGY